MHETAETAPDTYDLLERSREFLAAAYQAPLTLEDAARHACMSPFHFHRLFSRAFGETPHAYLTRLRMERARQLLLGTDLPVTEICLEVGYSSLGTFSRRFHERFGRPPSDYRQRARRYFPGFRSLPARFVPTCFLRAWGTLPETERKIGEAAAGTLVLRSA